MIFVGLIVAYGTLFLAGAGITLLLSARARELNLVEWFCLSWLFGVGAISLLLWICGAIVSGILLQVSVTALSVLLAYSGWRAFRRAGARLFLPRPRTRAEWILTALLAVQIAVIVCASCKRTLGWDGLLVWEIKARYAFLNDGVLPAAYFQGSGRAFSHPDYPLALPFTQLWIYLWMGEANQFWAKTIFMVFYAAGAALVALFSARLTGCRWIGLLAGVLFCFVPQAAVGIGSALVGYADFPLSIFYVAAIGYLLCASIGERPHAFWLYAACLTFLPWIKREGVILWVIAALLGVVLIFVQRRSKAWLLALLPGLCVIAGWQGFLRTINATHSLDFTPVSLEILRANLSRLGPIGHALLSEMTSVSRWGIFWLLAGIASLYMLRRWRDLRSWLLLAAVLSPIALYCLTYIFSAWPQYADHVESSLARLLMHVVPVAWLCISAAVSSSAARVTEKTCQPSLSAQTPMVDLA